MTLSPRMTHLKAAKLIKALGNEGAKLYLRRYFANKQNPVDPAQRRLEFALFFFPDAFSDDPPEFHLELFGLFDSGTNFAAAAPRGHAKTTISSVEVIYRLVNQLNHYTLVISDTYSQARDIVDNIRGELEGNQVILWMYGNLATDWHWTSGSFTTNTGIRVTARGSNMKVRGLKYRHWRPDFAITDDLENDEQVTKPERREKLLNWFKKALMPAMARKNSQIGVVGTVLHQDSLLNNALIGEKGFGGWSKHRWSALNVDADGHAQSLWPSMFPVDTLTKMRDDPTYEKYLGPIAFAQEMQNQAIDDRSRVIKSDWIFGTDDKPLTYSLTEKEEWWKRAHPGDDTKSWLESEITRVLMAVDPAISEKTTADYFSIFTVGIDKAGEIWMLDVMRDRIGDIDIQINKVLDMQKQWKAERINVESVAYQAGLARAIQREAARRGEHAPIFQVKPDRDKFQRAVIHSANFAGGLVHLRKDHPLFDALVKEILDFPVGEHDDMFDAFMHATESTVKRGVTRTFRNKPRGL